MIDQRYLSKNFLDSTANKNIDGKYVKIKIDGTNKSFVFDDIYSSNSCNSEYNTENEPDVLKSTSIMSNNKEAYYNSAYYSKIRTVQIDTTNVVPSDAVTSGNVSEDVNGSVIAWLTNNETSGYYDLHIGQKCGVIAGADVSYMFNELYILTSINLSNFDTSNVTNMAWMFCSCSSLTTLDLSNFDTSNVTDMSYMFYYCYSLTSIDLTSFDTSNVTNMKSMFYFCKKLTQITVGCKWTTASADTKSMFAVAGVSSVTQVC